MPTKLKQHLAIATGAVSAAAVPMGADAAIVYQDDSNAFTVQFRGTASAEWDIDGDGGNDFRLKTFVTTSSSYSYYFVSFSSAGGRNGRGLVATGGNEFNNLASGVGVGPTLTGTYTWAGSGNRALVEITTSGAIASSFGNGKLNDNNFIGFRFISGSDTLYGWGEIFVESGSVTVNRWAYNDTPDGGIEVGQTQGDTPVPAPAPSTLALLAAGAFGLRRWRAQRAAA